MVKRKTWRKKLERKQEPKVVDDPKGRERMLVPHLYSSITLYVKYPEGNLSL